MCGILALFNKTEIYYNKNHLINFIKMLEKLQHRGNDGFGVCLNSKVIIKKGLIKNNMDIVSEFNIKDNEIIDRMFMGHTRYITSGIKSNNVYQPIKGTSKFGNFTMLYNGNILFNEQEKEKEISNLADTQYIISFIEKNSYKYSEFSQVLEYFIMNIRRAYSIIIYFNNEVYAIRDSYGVRPLLYCEDDTSFLFSSESCVLESKIFKEVDPGSIVAIKNNTLTIKKINTNHNNLGKCLFEYVYFLNETSKWDNINVFDIRSSYGRILAENDVSIKNRKVLEDFVVIGIPTTGIIIGKGYAEHLDIPYKQLITKNKKFNRTFILKDNTERDRISKQKYIYNEEIKDKNIIIVDDSIVRGITTKNLVSSLYKYGAKEVHIRIGSPQIKNTCYYGIDIPTKEELIVNNFDSLEELNRELNSDSLMFISLNEVKKIMPNSHQLCSGCFGGSYESLLEW